MTRQRRPRMWRAGEAGGGKGLGGIRPGDHRGEKWSEVIQGIAVVMAVVTCCQSLSHWAQQQPLTTRLGIRGFHGILAIFFISSPLFFFTRYLVGEM